MSTELICGIVAAVALLKGLALGWFAGLQRGLYLGEKGRRQSAESMLVLGVPEAAPARRVIAGQAPLPIEPAQAPKGYDPATIDKGARTIQEEYRQLGMPVPSDKDARAQAQQMLHAMTVGVEDDVAIAGA